jgi:hypothetical protein
MLQLLATLALAQDPDPIQQNVDRVYGKAVPKEAVCVERPELTAPFLGTTVVAVRRGLRGCVLLGVMVGETWYEPGAALPAAVDRAAWDGLDAATRESRWLEWVDEVLLAFDQPVAGGLAQVTVDAKKKVTVIDRRYRRHEDSAGRSADAVTKWTFDNATLLVTTSAEQVLSREDVSLFQRAEKVEGMAEATVDEAIRSKGKTIRTCFTKAWEADLALSGRVRLEWSVADGKVVEVAVLADEKTNDTLAACYGRAIRSAAYPAGTSGSVRWVFGIDRTAASD